MAEPKLISEDSLNRDSFKLLATIAKELPKRWDSSKKFRVVIKHDPEKPGVSIDYYEYES